MWQARLSKESLKDLKEGLGSLVLCNLGDYISGIFLHVFKPIIERAPVILALLPAASDARGDVYSSYGSRLGTLLHLGLFDKHFRDELESLIVLIVIVNTWIGLLVALINTFLGSHLGLLDTVFLALMSAAISSVLMIPSTTLLALHSFKHGLDPDNLVAPIATLFGDMITIPSIIIGYEAELGLSTLAKLVAVTAFIAPAVFIIIRFYKNRATSSERYQRISRILKENLLIILASTFLSGLAGAFLLDNMIKLLSWPGVLTVVPAFLEDGGAIASRFSSRLATKLHLGDVKPQCLTLSPWVHEQFLVNIVHASIVFSSLGVLGAAVALLSGSSLLWGLRVFIAVLLAGLLLSTIISLITYCLAVGSFNYGLDPDNVLTPLLTSIADILGVMSLVGLVLLVS